MTAPALAVVIGRVPVDIGRDEAAAAARSELAKPVYGAHRPSLAEQLYRWIGDLVSRAFDAVVSVAPGGVVGLVVLAMVVVLVVVVVRWRVGPLQRAAAQDRSVFVGAVRSAAQYRADADRAAAAGNWDEAVRQRFRALVRALEERDVLDPRPGRTADEAAAEAALVLTGAAAALASAARTFDDVAYGGLHAEPDADRRLREVDRLVATTPVPRVELTGTAVGAGWEPLR